MDGNGRWANLKGRPRTYGHIKGTRVAKKIITECAHLGIEHLTLYAFSTENWLRPQAEVTLLMKLLKKYLERETKTLVAENIRFEVIGEIEKLPKDVIAAVNHTVEKTKNCNGLHLVFAISYGARKEITLAVKDIVQKVQAGVLSESEIDEATVSAALSTYPMPDPDLIIRTSGESRLSNFLLWQAAYTEFYFSNILWPDFTRDNLREAIAHYLKRERRFGVLSEPNEISAH